MKNRYFLVLSFLGTRYHGWQSQKNAGSVQSQVSEALSVILKTRVTVTGAGRTDAGVHALEFYLHFDYAGILDGTAREKLISRLNGYLPSDIGVHGIFPVKPDAHARFSAISRTYQYILVRNKDPFWEERAYFLSVPLDVGQMNRAAGILPETRDFSSFAKSPTDAKTPFCKVTRAFWKEDQNLLIFTITADRFLRNMVRAIVGTLIDTGRGKIAPEDLPAIVEKKDRSAAGYSVPACGLYLVSIQYPPEIFSEAL